MLPTIHIFGRTIAMYGFMITIGLIVGIAVAVLRSRKYNFLYEDVLFASFFGGIGLFLGAKLLFILTVIPKLIEHHKLLFTHPKILLVIITGGFVFYGGLLGAGLGIFIYCKKFHISTIKMFDVITPSIPLIHGFGRIGCNFAGCCYGIKYHGPGHVIFHLSDYAPNNIPLFPTQLLESFLNFFFAFYLILYTKKERRQGSILGIYLIYYAVMRFILEYFRGDISRGILLGLSTSQWISIVMLPIGLWLIIGIKQIKFNK